MITALRVVTFASLIALAVLQIAWHGWLAPPVILPVWFALVVALLPLLPAALAWRRGPRVLLWGTTACLLYFTHGVMESWASPAVRGLALVETALTVIAIGSLGVATFAEKARRRRDAAAAPTGALRPRARRA